MPGTPDTLFALAAGATETAAIDGISAAGADPALMAHTPSADAEILAYGRPVRAPVVPVSPTGCPTPAVVTRAVRERVEFGAVVLDAGLAEPTGAPTVDVGAGPGGNVRDPEPVPDAGGVFADARRFGADLPAARLVLAETIPGGTTTAMGVLAALGERRAVSSSLPENPLELKREVVREGLDASGLDRGDLAGQPTEAIRRMGDPVLATVAGVAVGALEAGTDVLLAGGTQLATAGALVRHAGVTSDLELATTSFVAGDDSADVRALAADNDLALTVTDPGFERRDDHPAMAAYLAGEAKEGVGMGGALALADEGGVGTDSVREAVAEVYDRVTEREVAP
ncbi:nicotinate-nucleotide--dimethylbenzimidazole phosphoribosyltransferase [Halobacterium sp. R2-5]|uniref:nicotinate-nucleotide--dimethylbenzimidazole phosphoribosyltransferase n=1 Tax=Halobacterium sp. R2-5 TaxID=2715751 RepID=UPI001421F6E8|nr:TIGR00303 family protein [Halobacterium sp. R2-5]NIC00200.1 TIGR00303 family protein [Halobacterium sp. R2-5]